MRRTNISSYKFRIVNEFLNYFAIHIDGNVDDDDDDGNDDDLKWHVLHFILKIT